MLEIFEIAAKAVADPTRIRILKLLQSGELCVCQLTTVLGLAPATVSKHLSVLKGAGLVQSRRDGKWVYYRLAESDFTPHARRFLDLLAVSLGDDPTIAADKILMLQVNAVPLQVLCDQGRAALPETLSQAAPSCCGATP
ncbi:metalloregulator ArsR/SmtB family transcription factor [Magnetospirillum sp. 64-120]|uniref:ArsR/SmtB family transcription factor n=1 Tax=Magnetospirillum sp. 64-120 TaxID=1895778 RepID=UPI000925BF9D|nr:metalloregulator ArsR/SmtB family transcription factor [Magnetospirillum sp. 64-120]OJX81269.1 MAG: transcriptional regulator [Magnetospirillum sp. 64-120]